MMMLMTIAISNNSGTVRTSSHHTRLLRSYCSSRYARNGKCHRETELGAEQPTTEIAQSQPQLLLDIISGSHRQVVDWAIGQKASGGPSERDQFHPRTRFLLVSFIVNPGLLPHRHAAPFKPSINSLLVQDDPRGPRGKWCYSPRGGCAAFRFVRGSIPHPTAARALIQHKPIPINNKAIRHKRSAIATPTPRRRVAGDIIVESGTRNYAVQRPGNVMPLTSSNVACATGHDNNGTSR
ncbi:hypothetical protein F4778DRAFT_137242 [Xylariomycetidae sp. FL2044]|nr:hypothetical protein F4778DRAFT_137242 [Xylariomycetidae sp. FL2044]